MMVMIIGSLDLVMAFGMPVKSLKIVQMDNMMHGKNLLIVIMVNMIHGKHTQMEMVNMMTVKNL